MKTTTFLATGIILASSSSTFAAPVSQSSSAQRAAQRAAENPAVYIISPLLEDSHIPSSNSIDEYREKHRPNSSPDQITVVRPVAIENYADPASTKPSGNERGTENQASKGGMDDYGKQGDRGAPNWQRKRSVPEPVHPGFTFGHQTPAALDAIIAEEDAEKAAGAEKEKPPPSSAEVTVEAPRQKMSKWNKYLVIPAATAAIVVLGLGAAAYDRQQPGWQSNESWGYKN